MKRYVVFKENCSKTEHEYIGCFWLSEDERIVIRTMNEDGLYHDVADLQEGVDL